MKKHVFLTGQPGVGKSTTLRAAIKQYRHRLGGFVTNEIRVNGERVGFEVEFMSGRKVQLAHRGFESPLRVGKYGIDRHVIDQLLPEAIDRAVVYYNVVVIDELANMQLVSDAFCAAVTRAFRASKPIIGTMHAAYHPFTFMVKEREGRDVEVIEVTHDNRDQLARELAERVRSLVG